MHIKKVRLKTLMTQVPKHSFAIAHSYKIKEKRRNEYASVDPWRYSKVNIPRDIGMQVGKNGGVAAKRKRYTEEMRVGSTEERKGRIHV